ncbi:MAG: RidA family protein [Propionibacteriaceae bacterium]|nr:RidA family protein [Propionibacteriaceae bacterium]
MATQRRRSIDVDGLGHGGIPIPEASRVGPLLVSGGIGPMDPATGSVSDDQATQVATAFDNVIRVMTAAGGTTDDIVKVTVLARDRTIRGAVDARWVEMFPDPDSRPARHMLVTDLAGSTLIQLEIIAYLGGQE